MNIVVSNAEDTCLTNHNTQSATADFQQSQIPTSTNLNRLNDSVKRSPEKNERVSQNQREAPSSEINGEVKDDFPEGGVQAWSVVIGSFCGLFAVFGIINSTAVFQEYFSTHQLSQYSPGQIGWIFSLQLFLTFFGGGLIGPIFDARGPRLLIICGSVFLVASMVLLGFCTRMYLLEGAVPAKH